MKILAFDTAVHGISIALCNEGKIVTRQIETMREQASLLVPMLQGVLEEGGLNFKDIDAFGCTIGPGSFTGLRIGLTTAKTLALVNDKPVFGINTLTLMARHYDTKAPLLILLETKRQDFYARYYDQNLNPISHPFVGSSRDILEQAPYENFSIGGDCLERFKSVSGFDKANYLKNIAQPNPKILLDITLQKFENNDVGYTPLKPLYLRGADTSQPKNKPRTLEKAN